LACDQSEAKKKPPQKAAPKGLSEAQVEYCIEVIVQSHVALI
jgi:hypothetical protein